MKTYVMALLRTLNDDCGDLRNIFFPLGNDHSQEFDNVAHTISSELGLNADVEVLSVFRISSPLVTTRLEAFHASEHNARLMLFPPTNLAEVHSIVINGFHPFEDYIFRFCSLS